MGDPNGGFVEPAKSVILTRRWHGRIFVVNGAVAGKAQKGAGATGKWFAYGRVNDWAEETPLGSHDTERDAKRAVEAWVDEQIALEQR